MKNAKFKFGDDVAPLLKTKGTEFIYTFEGTQTVKHLIESVGVPHTEIGAILVNGEAEDLGYLVNDNDSIDVRSRIYIANNLQPLNFLLDNHLGRLAKYLRLIGFDSAYRNDFLDEELTTIAVQSNRMLLTRDVRLLMRKLIKNGYWVRSKIPKDQLLEIVRKFHLSDKIKPFTRCIRCNGILNSIDKNTIRNRLQFLTDKYYDDFKICDTCRQIYWEGSHFKNIQVILDKIVDA